MTLDQCLDLAIDRCRNIDNDNWHYFCSIYPFTSENITGYLDLFDFNDRSLLTVGSSCDQILNAILKGCKDITLLDINPFVKYYYYLKVSAILTLNPDNYLSFFKYDYAKRNNFDVFNQNTFNDIRETLMFINYEAYLFWVELFQICSPLIVRKSLFSTDESNRKRIIGSNPYLLNETNYHVLRDNILTTEPTFINQDIFYFNASNKYDNIWLSNIATYITGYDKIDEMVTKYYASLNEKGSFLCSYLYEINDIDEEYSGLDSTIYDLRYFFTKYHSLNPQLSTFDGVFNLTNSHKKVTDAALILKK